MATATATALLDCGHAPSEHGDSTTGYGTDAEGRTYCYACCADNDRAAMIATGRATLYLSGNWSDRTSVVTNWPGSLSFRASYQKTGRHNIAGKRYDVWFTGPDGKHWHGYQVGDNTQICHCRRVK